MDDSVNQNGKPSTINLLISEGWVLIDEQPMIVNNKLGAEGLFTAADCARGRERLLHHKADRTVDYALSLWDEGVFNALRYMVPDGPANNYVMAGFYLMLADAVSQERSPMTFLTAMRDAGVDLSVNEKVPLDYERRTELFENAMKALHTLGIAEKCGEKLESWKNNGSYMYAGIPHGVTTAKLPDLKINLPEGVGDYRVDGKNAKGLEVCSYGAYTELAYMVLIQHGSLFNANDLISYALGNRDKMRELAGKSEEEILALNIRPGIHDKVAGKENVSRIWEEQGVEGRGMRAMRMYNSAIENYSPASTARAIENQKQHEPMARAILEHFPEEIREYLLREGEAIIYSSKNTIANIYPQKNPSGLTEASCNETRISTGGRLSRFDTLFVSFGGRDEPQDLTPEQAMAYRAQAAASTSLHEIFHDLFSRMSDDTRTALVKKVDALQQRFKDASLPEEPLVTMTGHSLNQILVLRKWNECYGKGERNAGKTNFYNSYLPAGYTEQGKLMRAADASKQEEVLCNFYALMNTELRGNPVLQIPELAELKQSMEAAIAGIMPQKPKTVAADTNGIALDTMRSADFHGQGGGTGAFHGS